VTPPSVRADVAPSGSARHRLQTPSPRPNVSSNSMRRPQLRQVRPVSFRKSPRITSPNVLMLFIMAGASSKVQLPCRSLLLMRSSRFKPIK
jgi:hypothetical protein